MAVLGLVLLVAAGLLTAAVVTSNTSAIETDLWGVTISNLTVGIVFVAGILTTVVAVAGLALLTSGLRRARRLRRERLELRRENQRLVQQAEPHPNVDDRTADYPAETSQVAPGDERVASADTTRTEDVSAGYSPGDGVDSPGRATRPVEGTMDQPGAAPTTDRTQRIG